MSSMRVLATGVGGFIGHHLVLVAKGYLVRGVDQKRLEYAIIRSRLHQ
jgi:nucleoside-diphosphate-sugar epimerase